MASIARILPLLMIAPFLMIAPLLAVASGPDDIVWLLGGGSAVALFFSLLVASLLTATRMKFKAAFVVLAGTTTGAVAVGLTEGVYVSAHLARGGFLNFEVFDSQWQMAVGLILFFAAFGAAAGLAMGSSVAIVLVVGSLITSKRRHGAGAH